MEKEYPIKYGVLCLLPCWLLNVSWHPPSFSWHLVLKVSLKMLTLLLKGILHQRINLILWEGMGWGICHLAQRGPKYPNLSEDVNNYVSGISIINNYVSGISRGNTTDQLRREVPTAKYLEAWDLVVPSGAYKSRSTQNNFLTPQVSFRAILGQMIFKSNFGEDSFKPDSW